MKYALFERVPYEGDNFLGVYSSKKKAKEALEKNKGQTILRGDLYIVQVNLNDSVKHYFSFEGELV